MHFRFDQRANRAWSALWNSSARARAIRVGPDLHHLPRPDAGTPEGSGGLSPQKCLNCHETKPCGLPSDVRLKKSPADNCADCHMPKGDSEVAAHRVQPPPDRDTSAEGVAPAGRTEFARTRTHPAR